MPKKQYFNDPNDSDDIKDFDEYKEEEGEPEHGDIEEAGRREKIGERGGEGVSGGEEDKRKKEGEGEREGGQESKEKEVSIQEKYMDMLLSMQKQIEKISQSIEQLSEQIKQKEKARVSRYSYQDLNVARELIEFFKNEVEPFMNKYLRTETKAFIASKYVTEMIKTMFMKWYTVQPMVMSFEEYTKVLDDMKVKVKELTEGLKQGKITMDDFVSKLMDIVLSQMPSQKTRTLLKTETVQPPQQLQPPLQQQPVQIQQQPTLPPTPSPSPTPTTIENAVEKLFKEEEGKGGEKEEEEKEEEKKKEK